MSIHNLRCSIQLIKIAKREIESLKKQIVNKTLALQPTSYIESIEGSHLLSVARGNVEMKCCVFSSEFFIWPLYFNQLGPYA